MSSRGRDEPRKPEPPARESTVRGARPGTAVAARTGHARRTHANGNGNGAADRANGNGIEVLVADGDSERASLLETLRQSRRDLEEAQRIARIGSWTLDPATGDATWSSEMHYILGLDPNGPAISLDNISTIFSADSVAEVGAAVQRAVESGEPWKIDLEMVGPDGAGRGWVLSNGVVERGPDGSVVKIRGTMQDVSDQRRLEAQLRQSQRLEAVGQLAGGIAHDFNNLLTAIRGYAQLVREDLPEDHPSGPDIDQVVLAADRAAELTKQLLAFSRRQLLQPRVIEPGEIVTHIAPMIHRLLGAHIQLVTHAREGVGRIKVDPSQFEQVIVNLAVNAGDSMPDGGHLTIETANVELDAAYAAEHADVAPGPYVGLIVSDTGAGMDAPTRARIFEPFFTTKASGRGTGMGLATVHGIVYQSGGSIYVYSEPGLGTSFKVYLPRVDAEVAADDMGVTTGVPSGTETVLLVEDEEPVREFASRVLSGLGYTLLQASNGAQALELVAADPRPIHLLLTDVTMPGMQGHQLAAVLRAERPGLRVLYISGFTKSTVGRPGSEGDGSAFLAKPFAGDALGRAVRNALDEGA